ncbi:tetratricopeptide repeat protein [Treponema phagedenis]|uniref:Tetratricopeptide repeat protein n=1 Tax=Treponema phagedenis TaxID=162 RepID=A0A0B7GUI4_TREPH|nr:tetratricopeptide repeat protein [Treponema phagedenis]NVP24431.1 tetratricopeptide repeat protein [Treponema phagedenis]QEJ95451.1 tetratricopeptide repeat protein [Treponema phagedenis]QEJ97807.1 tetratricopeptide repeat protein [Treponema phagedenis]QEK01305.1 tetratricopeptide repeat protein [Treponema phagedenis]QEK03374.1 tetratricopeptide repeat protein [Treponema phagedenis]
MALQNENNTIGVVINDFLAAKRRFILIGFLAIIAIIVGVTVYLTITSKMHRTAATKVEEIRNEWVSEKEKNSENTGTKENEIIQKLGKIASSNKNSYAGTRAYTTIAEIYFSRKDWENAMKNYELAAESSKKTYLSGVNYFNAAVCADESGKQDLALDYYNKSAGAPEFPLQPRAMFNIGRLQEALSHTEEAIEAYNKLLEKFPNDNWALLGKSRIIELSLSH